ncbi:MAG: efflux RND transporter periplasmic adaptor subunit, partial [Candidatus Omnitrophica bacterium]|nr:efflux RND transporter periplasmic adaptor subunit [Candidatus Omnitrophota bacterium]
QLPAALEQLLGGGGAEQEKIPVRVYKVAKSDFQDELSVVGTIKSIPEIDLKFEINGRVTEIRFKEGQKVKNGDLVAKLDQKDAQLELEWVKAKYEAAKAEADSVKKRSEVIEKLFQTGAIIEARVEEARAEIKAAEERAHVAAVEIKSSQARLEKTNLYASQNGIMGPRDMDAGEFITPQDRIGTLLSEENMFVEVGIIEKDIYKIQVGQRVVVNVDAYPKTDFYGVVDNIFPVLEGKTRSLNVRVKLIESRGMLLPGMFARSRIAIYSKKEAIIVPTSSVTVEEKRYFAACIEDEKVKNKEVFLEYLTTDYAVVKTGIKEGDLVIVETPGLKKLKDGTPVDIMEMQEQLTSGS